MKQSHGDAEDFLKDFSTCQPYTPSLPELDEPISRTYIMNGIKKLKPNKAHGPDIFLNKYFIESVIILNDHLEVLFNKILDSKFPSV